MADEQQWEDVMTGPFDAVQRLAVPGGWLYRNVLGGSVPVVTFVPYSNDADRKVDDTIASSAQDATVSHE